MHWLELRRVHIAFFLFFLVVRFLKPHDDFWEEACGPLG